MADRRNIPGLGRFTIIEIYESYDSLPLLFSCKNAANHLYLAVAVAENEFADTWLYARISQARLNLVRSGTIDLHDAFSKVGGGLLLRVLFSKEGLPTEVRVIQSSEVPDFLLPLPSERLDLKSEVLL